MSKKKIVCYILGISLMLGLTGCSGFQNGKDSDTKTVQEDVSESPADMDSVEKELTPAYVFKEQDDTNLAAMFFIGSGNQEQKEKLPVFLEKYKLTQAMFQIVAEKDNCEWYAIIPKYIGTKIKVERVEPVEAGELIPVEKITETETPVLLCCNESDIVPSVKVTITFGKEQIEFNPFLSLKDGTMQKVDRIFTE